MGENMNRKSHYALMAATAFASGVFGTALTAQGQISLTGSTYGQEFDSLPSAGSFTWTDNSTIPGWFVARATGAGVTTAGTGSSNSGGLYSYGSVDDPERSLGTVGSSNNNFAYGAWFTNNTGATIDTLTIGYTGE